MVERDGSNLRGRASRPMVDSGAKRNTPYTASIAD